MGDRTVVGKSWTVTVKIVREEMVSYRDIHSSRIDSPAPMKEHTEEMDVTITQDTLAYAIDMATDILKLRRPGE